MRVVIVEDEIPAAAKLKKMLEQVAAEIEVEQVLSSVKDAFTWFHTHPTPDLIFMDIQLSDGLSLDLVEKASITCPIIFITAFDEYWQRAFEYNSIDYLLKPLKQERLKAALTKFHELKDYFTARYNNLLAYQIGDKRFKERFLVKRGKEYASIKTNDIAFFYATHKLVCLVEKEGSKFIMDNSLSEIEKQVDPFYFFRANRKYLIHKKSVKKIISLPKSKLLLELAPVSPGELIVSSDNSSDFKTWMND